MYFSPPFLYICPVTKPIKVMTTKKQLRAQVDAAIKSEYPNAKAISQKLLKELWFEDEFSPVAYYIVNEIPGADEYGRNEEMDYEDLDESIEFVAITVTQHKESGRVFFSKLNHYGESVNSYGETDGEIEGDTLIFETARDHGI